jgi:hypothetical protein
MIIIHGQLLSSCFVKKKYYQVAMKCKNVVQYEVYLWGDTMRSILVIPVHSANPV